METVFKFLASDAGRAVRASAGTALVILGIKEAEKNWWGWLLAAVGLAPLSAGIFDFCIFAPLFKRPFGGKQLRDRLNEGEA